MASEFNPAFRATSGLDAAGEKVINVAKADFNTLSDGVNVDFFIEENTLQQYKEDRGYRKDFAVIQKNRIWVSNRVIPEPAGVFVPEYWTAVRTDPKWKEITGQLYNLESGDYVTVNSSVSKCTLTLPLTPNDGDTIVVKDIGNQPGYNEMRILSSDQLIVRFGVAADRVLLSKPESYNILVFSNRQWQFYQTAEESHGIKVTSNAEYRAQPGDRILRRYIDKRPVKIILPSFANDGDMVHSVDIDGGGPVYHLIVRTIDPTISIGQIGTTSKEFRTTGDGFFVYNAADKLWTIWDGDLRTRIRVIKGDPNSPTTTDNLRANESVTVMGDNNTTEQTITLNFPVDIAVGDTVKVALNYLRKKQTVILKAATGSKILTKIELLQFPKRSEYPPDATWVDVDSLEFNGDTNYTPVIEFSYIEDNGKKYWIVAQNVPTVERVDAKDLNTRKRLGVISLASQTEAWAEPGSVGIQKESAITPETLAGRTAEEFRTGIARIVTSAEIAIDNPTKADHDRLIVTPFKLNERTATETRRGVAEVATQPEADAGVLDTHIITPKKLNDRKATEILTGIAKLVSTTGTKAADTRDLIGTNVYNVNNNTDIVTPKSLNQLKGTYTSQGLFYKAKDTEVINGVADNGFDNVAVTPVELHKKTATEDRIGFAEIATQQETDAGTDDSRIVTPKKLNNRKASETLTGIARVATQPEFDAGLLDNVISTPLKIQTYFNKPERVTIDSASGLVQTGTLWDHYTLNIQAASETQRGTLKLATKALTDAGVDDSTAITPKKLNDKKANETAEGIIQVASQTEVVAGTVGNKAVPPVHLKYIAQQEKSWEASPTLRGFVKISEGAITWLGDDTNGSVSNVETFQKSGYAISPYELNKTLTHYLPIKGKAFDSDKLDGLDSLQFIRSDIDQDVNGIISFKKQINLAAPLVSTSTGSFTGDLNSSTLTTKGPITIQNGTNVWKMNAPLNGTTLTFGNTTNVLTLNTDSGNAAVLNNISAGNLISAQTGYNIGVSPNAKPAISLDGGKIAFGNTEQSAIIKANNASVVVNDGTNDYKVLTEKNMTELVGTGFVKKIGDTMSGKLSIDAPVLPKITEAQATAPLTLATMGFWTADITTKAVYDALPGYAIPVFKNNEQGNPYVDSYTYKTAPGLMTCTGTSLNNIYRTWTPRPTTEVLNENAQTQWISIWDIARGKWGDWARVLTSQLPPTPSDIGAVSSSGSAFNNLTVRDWLQVGQVRIEPDPVTRSVKFTWIDI